MSAVEVGRIAALLRYPVKSMAGERLEQVDVSWQGLAGDRRWAFIRDGLERSDFPWLTIRERPDMWQYRPSLLEPDRPDASKTVVMTPGGDELDVADPALAAQLGLGVRVIKQNRGVFDWMPLSLLSTQAVTALSQLVGAELGFERFRPNLLVHARSDDGFPEDAWVGSELRIGQLVMRVDERDQRCAMTNVDPATSKRDPTILRMIARERAACLGVYGSVVRQGRVAVGDPVSIER